MRNAELNDELHAAGGAPFNSAFRIPHSAFLMIPHSAFFIPHSP
jgi:hypothetical protein